MTLTVLSVAYPFAPVGRDAVGGAEQVLWALDEGLVSAGLRSIVVAREDSHVAGELFGLEVVDGSLDIPVRARHQAEARQRLEMILDREPVDVVHYHGIDFPAYQVTGAPPALATLHLPATWYPMSIFAEGSPGPWLVPVSAAQARTCPPAARLLSPIENGVAVADLQAVSLTRRGFALLLARICPEKGVHLALQAAHRAGVALLIGGEVFDYPEHGRYFEEEVRPLLDARRVFLGPLGFPRKRRLLAAARCLLVPALADETSSLVTREAIACGTPVIAFPRGALPDTVRHGVTGFLVDDVEGMARAIGDVPSLDPAAARAEARSRFDRRGMVAAYLDLYERLASPGRSTGRRVS